MKKNINKKIHQYFESFNDEEVELSEELNKVIDALPEKKLSPVQCKCSWRRWTIALTSFVLLVVVGITSTFLWNAGTLPDDSDPGSQNLTLPAYVPTNDALVFAVLNYADTMELGALDLSLTQNYLRENYSPASAKISYPFTGIVIREAYIFSVIVPEDNTGFLSKQCGSGVLRTIIAKFDLFDGPELWDNDEWIIVIEGSIGVFHALTNSQGNIIENGQIVTNLWEFSDHKRIIGKEVVKQERYPIKKVYVEKTGSDVNFGTSLLMENGSQEESQFYRLQANSLEYYDKEMIYDALDFVDPELLGKIVSDPKEKMITYLDENGVSVTKNVHVVSLEYVDEEDGKQLKRQCQVIITEETVLNVPIKDLGIGRGVKISFTEVNQTLNQIFAKTCLVSE